MLLKALVTVLLCCVQASVAGHRHRRNAPYGHQPPLNDNGPPNTNTNPSNTNNNPPNTITNPPDTNTNTNTNPSTTVSNNNPSTNKCSYVAPKSADKMLPQHAGSLFVSFNTKAPPQTVYSSYPFPPVNLPSGVVTGPIGTNKWYTPLLLSGSNSIFPLPYGFTYLDGTSKDGTTGLGVLPAQSGQVTQDAPPSYVHSPIISFSLGASEITKSKISASLTNFNEFAAAFTLTPGDPKQTLSQMRFQLSRGSAFITTLYSALTPVISSPNDITSYTKGQDVNGFSKSRVAYKDGTSWLIYTMTLDGSGPLVLTEKDDKKTLSAVKPWSGVMQIVQQSGAAHEDDLYDSSVGVWVIGATITTYDDSPGKYAFVWDLDGPTACKAWPLIFALPHHVASLASNIQPTIPKVTVPSRTNGIMTLYKNPVWIFMEDTSIVAKFSGLDSSNPTFTNNPQPSDVDYNLLRAFVTADIQNDFEANRDSYYFGGRRLARQALICLTAHTILKDGGLTQTCLIGAKASYMLYVNQKAAASPLLYDSTWKGIISSKFLQKGADLTADLANGLYDDHHFHYAYFIHAAAILTHIDPSFRKDVEPFVTALIRDANNLSTQDVYFPFSRHFDWYAGYAWSTGLRSNPDGKLAGSMSEQFNFYSAQKDWATVTGQQNLVNISNLQMKILQRTSNTYFLMKKSNTVEPKDYIRFRVPGSFFENKIMYDLSWTHMEEAMHMVQVTPILPITPFARDATFIEDEWHTKVNGDTGKEDLGALAYDYNNGNGYRTILMTQYGGLHADEVIKKFSADHANMVMDDGLSFSWAFGYLLSQLGYQASKS